MVCSPFQGVRDATPAYDRHGNGVPTRRLDPLRSRGEDAAHEESHVGDTSHLQTRIMEEFVKRVNEAPDLDVAIKERITKLATTNPERAKADQIRTAILGEGDVK